MTTSPLPASSDSHYFNQYYPFAAELPPLSYNHRAMDLHELKKKLYDDFPPDDEIQERFRILEFTIQFKRLNDRMIYALKYL